MTTSTHLVPWDGSVVAVKILQSDGAQVSFTLTNPTDEEVESAAVADPEAMRQLSDYLKKHDKDDGPYRRTRVGFSVK